ncbi:phage late gene regulator [Escherichia coli]|nr:phage late gene regulator [Escherichia coli]
MNKENVITLDNPVKRGEQVIEQVTLMKPNAGTLRGVSLAAVANSEVDALIKVLPRMTAPMLHTKDPKPQKQKVKLKRKKKEKHLRALEHPKAKPVTQKKAPKVPEAREGEYMAGEADNVFALTTVYATKAQAMRAAQAKWDKLQRGVAEFSISLATGRADIYTETPVKVSGFKRVIDEQDWTITKVTHFLNNSGFTTSLELEVRLSDVEYETEDDG